MTLKTLAHAAGLAAVVAMGTPAAQAAIYTLDFDPAVACGPRACTNSSAISQTYGDVADVVDVQFDSVVDVPFASSFRYRASGFSDLVGTADSGTVFRAAEIFLKPLDGLGVRLLDFDLGVAGGGQAPAQITILTGGMTTLFSSGAITVGLPGNVHSSYRFDLFSADGIRIRWASEGSVFVGIDNIRFETGVIPEPSTYALLGAGLLGIGATLRRRGTRRG